MYYPARFALEILNSPGYLSIYDYVKSTQPNFLRYLSIEEQADFAQLRLR